jgi:hypothetical protein
MASESTQGIDALKTYEGDPVAGEAKITKPKHRLKSADVLRAMHERLVDADEVSERNRAKIQDLKDYKPPLNARHLKARGQSGRFNINFGETAAQINEAMATYVDDFVAPEHLVPVKLEYNTFEPTEQKKYETILSDEFTRMVRDWSDGLFTYLTLVDQFVTQGIAIGYYADRDTWQWSSAGLREMKFPRRTKAKSESIEVATCEYQASPTDLAKYIQDEEAATSLGWNVPAVKKVLASGSSDLYDDQSPEDRKEQEKANDYDDTTNPFSVVNLVYGWVKEFDGTVSFYMATRSDAGAKASDFGKLPPEFLYKKNNAYDDMSQAMHIFPYYTGNKGNIYSIRGLGYMAYSQGMASNLMQCAMLDSAKDSMSVKYVATSEKGITSLPIINAGPYSLVPPSLQTLADQKAPDLQKSAIPALQMLQEQIERRSSQAAMSSNFKNAPDRRSSSEAMAAVEHFSSINSAAMLLWSRPWRDLIVESVRRAFDGTQNDQIPSGKSAADMQKQCLLRGVPEAAFSKIDFRLTKTSIPVGPGSKAARAAQRQQGAALYTSMDVPGRASFDRDTAIDIWGVERATEYMPPVDGPRETIDFSIARLENNDLVEGQEVEPSPSENFIVHLNVHIPKLTEYIQLVEEGQMELTEATKDMLSLFEHAVATFEMAVVPELIVPELKQHKQTLQQIGEYVNNGIRAIQKQDRDNAEAQQQQQAEGGEQGGDSEEAIAEDKHDMQMQRDAETAMQKLQQSDAAFQQAQVQSRQKAIQEIAINDAKAASSISK